MDKKEYHRQYYLKNKEKLINKQKEYYKNNQEKVINNQKEYYKNNRNERLNYCKTDNGRKSCRISNWKKMGVLSDDYNKLYDYYLSVKECENCGVDLVEGHFGANKKCLDHNHNTGEFRNVLCNTCNILRK